MSTERTGNNDTPEAPSARELGTPSAEALLGAVLELSRDTRVEVDEATLVRRFLSTLLELFPRRRFAVRVVDVWSNERARVYLGAGEIRPGIERERLTLRQSAADGAGLKTALTESARLRIDERWDCPFKHTAAGFTVPLVSSGELYGVVDVGYELGFDKALQDELLLMPLANHVAMALRNERLHRETTNLRDYQTRLIEQANALILGVGSDWRINVFNRALVKLTGFEHDELIGRDLRDWLPAEESARLTKLFLRGKDGSGRDSVDVSLPTKSGGSIRTVWSVAAVGKQGHLQALVGIGQDQTQLRELQEQVIHAEKLATLGQLAAGVVHELNNPLTSITVYAEYLVKKLELEQELGDGDLHKIKQISSSARRIMVFAQELVQYAKPSSEKVEPTALNPAVRHALSFGEHLFEQSNVNLSESLVDGLPEVMTAAGQLEQIVINLVTNAVHAMQDRGTVTVATSERPTGAALIVYDDGPGIPFEMRDRVFEPFYTTKTDGKGTGLGLSIVKNIVEQHGGTLDLDASEAGGARFTVVFTRARLSG